MCKRSAKKIFYVLRIFPVFAIELFVDCVGVASKLLRPTIKIGRK